MHARSASFLLTLAIAIPVVEFSATTARAQQQVSDADRNAARDLYQEGDTLRQQGRYADALDRFQRSFAVFPAPTTAFRIAQCKTALGKLVEAAEEFRAVTNVQLPASPPEAYVKAKQDAAVELGLLEPRIPKLKINVNPSPLAGLTVTIDGTAMPIALVGVARPINPGSHRIVAPAAGYNPAQAQVDVRERQQPIPEITLTLQQNGISYTTVPPTNGGTTTYQQGGTTTYQGGTNSTYGGTYQGGYQQPQGNGAYPYNTWVPPRRRPEGPRNALMLGVDAAASIPFGNVANYDLSNQYSVGGAFGVDVGLRLARILYLGAMAQGSFFGGNANGTPASSGGVAFSLAAVLGFMSNPEGAGIYFEIGGGIRTISLSTPNISLLTGDFIIGIGAQVKAGNFRVVPKIDLYVGPNDQASAHGFFTIGLAFFWELPLDRPVVAATVQPAY